LSDEDRKYVRVVESSSNPFVSNSNTGNSKHLKEPHCSITIHNVSSQRKQKIEKLLFDVLRPHLTPEDYTSDECDSSLNMDMYNSFFIDRSSGSSSVSVQYERTATVNALSYDGNSSNSMSQNKCWNCEQTGHAVGDCVLPRNQERVHANRRTHLQEKSDRSFENPRSRYYSDEDSKENSSKTHSAIPQFSPSPNLRPGVLSPSLRYALGIRSDELPPFYWNMYLYGYPPGYTIWHPDDVYRSSPQYSVYFPGLFPGEIPALPMSHANYSPIKKEKPIIKKVIESDITEVDMDLGEQVPEKSETKTDTNTNTFPVLDLNMEPASQESIIVNDKHPIPEQIKMKTKAEDNVCVDTVESSPSNFFSSIKVILGNSSRKKRRISKSSSETPPQ